MLPVAARIDFKIVVITFNLLTTKQPCYLRELVQLRRPSRSLGQAITTYSTFHGPRTVFCTAEFCTRCPRFWNSLPHTIADDLNILYQSLNPDLKHSSTEDPISISITTP